MKIISKRDNKYPLKINSSTMPAVSAVNTSNNLLFRKRRIISAMLSLLFNKPVKDNMILIIATPTMSVKKMAKIDST